MAIFRITYAWNDCGRSKTYRAESEGEAIELFEEWADRQDADVELLTIVEVMGSDAQ